MKCGYDELGNLISLTYPGGEIVRYTYYKNGLLKTATDGKGQTTSYEYDASGNLTRTVRPNGTEELCAYNKAGLLIEQKDICGEEVLTTIIIPTMAMATSPPSKVRKPLIQWKVSATLSVPP